MQFDFIGIGVSKSGTSWIWSNLVKHPEICYVPIKEGYYFTPRKGSQNNTYRKLFRTKKHVDYEKLYSVCGPDELKGEYSVGYFFHPELAEEISLAMPNVKLILILRNPIERAFSLWKFDQFVSFGCAKHDFITCFREDLKFKGQSLLWSKDYLKNLKAWMNFFPKKQLYISYYDDLVANPLKYIQGIFKFLGIDNKFVPHNYKKQVNNKSYVQYYQDNPIHMTSEERKIVTRYFRKSILSLQEFLNKDLSNWLKK